MNRRSMIGLLFGGVVGGCAALKPTGGVIHNYVEPSSLKELRKINSYKAKPGTYYGKLKTL